MRINSKLVLTILLLALFFYAPACFAQEVSSNELIKNAKQYDGQSIVYSGEVIGDVMARGNYAWVNINDGDNALGVWMDISLAKEIKFTGNYQARGDVLEIAGIFHRACPQHGGDLDIHVQSLRNSSPGRIVRQKLNFDKVNLSLILLGILFLIWILTLFRRK